jgi:hypothetical protein
MKQSMLTTVAALLTIGLLVQIGGQAGDKKESPWKPILPAEAYKELTERSIKAIEETAKANAAGAREKVNVEAAILAAYTLSAKDPNAGGAAQLRGAALAAGKMDLTKLAAFGSTVASAPKAPADNKAINVELASLMVIFRSKAKGGEGIYADLQYQPKLKNQNGIEALLSALAAKKITDDNLAKIAKELPNFAYRMAVVASITHGKAPDKKAAEWHDLSIKMRDTSIALAEAAQKKNTSGVFKAAQALESSCIDCHSVFKAN